MRQVTIRVAELPESHSPPTVPVHQSGFRHICNITYSERRRQRHPASSISNMARDKATITVDRAKVDRAMALTDVGTTSGVIDHALDRLIRAELLRRDIDAYRQSPVTAGELAVLDIPVAFSLDDDGTDYEVLYGDGD